jgi:hypothetical protein
VSIKVLLRNTVYLILLVLVVGTGLIFPQGSDEKARRYTRAMEFDYLDWSVDTLWQKITQGKDQKLGSVEQKEQVYAYLQLVAEVQNLDNQIAILYADPTIKDPAAGSASFITSLKELKQQQNSMTPGVEKILQEQVSSVLAKENIEDSSSVFPPVLYHISPLPLSLLISPRDRIQLDADISIQPGLSDDQKSDLESEVESGMNVSALVEEVGGIGTYPSMIMMTTDLNWLVDTIAHEWVHNYLTLHPLGLNYDTSSELRTMNETTAGLAGTEIGQKVIETFYPELIPIPVSPASSEATVLPQPPTFDFDEEMRITRENVDTMLSQGEIEKAEIYMESRRRVFWENGYLIRRINQAYFAFYGAYNDTPGGGAAGSDPVGPAVVQLRQKSDSLGDFLKTIAEMDSFQQLESAISDN